MWKKLVAPVGLVIFFWGASTISSTWYIRWHEQAQEQMIRDDLSTMRSAGDLRYDVRRMQRIAAETNRPAAPAAVAEIDRLEHEFERHLQEAIATSFTPEELTLDREIRARFETYRSEIQRQCQEPVSRDLLAESRTRGRLADELTDAARRLGEVNQGLMSDATTRRSRTTFLIIAMHYAVLIVSPFAGILCVLWISRVFNRSISRVSITLSDAAMEMHVGGNRVNVGDVNVGDSGDTTAGGRCGRTNSTGDPGIAGCAPEGGRWRAARGAGRDGGRCGA
jgi:hypothetical protein